MRNRKSLDEIKSILALHKKELAQKYKVKEIGVFGSYARGEQRKRSDVDILVELEEPVSLLKLVSLENFLKELVGIKVEVVPRRDLRAELKARVLEETVYV